MENLTIETVKDFLEANKNDENIKEFTASFINKDSVNNYLGTEDGKKLLQPKLDRAVTKGLSTWRDNNLEGLINDEIGKRFPAETEEQKRIRELETLVKQNEREKTLATYKGNAISVLNESNIDGAFAEFLVGETEEATNDAVNTFSTLFNKAVTDEVERRLKENGSTPPAGKKPATGEMTKAKLMGLSLKERTQFFNDNPEQFRQLMGL